MFEPSMSSLEQFLHQEMVSALGRAGLFLPEPFPPMQYPPPSLGGRGHLTHALPLTLAAKSQLAVAELAQLLKSHLSGHPDYCCDVTPHYWLTFSLHSSLLTTHLELFWRQEFGELTCDLGRELWVSTIEKTIEQTTNGLMEYTHASCCRYLRLARRLAIPHPWHGSWQFCDDHPQAIALALVILMLSRRSCQLITTAHDFLNICPWIHEPQPIAQSRLGLIALTQKALALVGGKHLKNYCEL
ncbi:MAG: hypothetical protein HC919_09395 [Oscillatoriales cyanobacterium SM2_2_1]|nr:hypothetical protein [Oscillatoriales cyanobacterium SM2_2_1]